MLPTITGVIPVAPTVFDDDEELDLPGQARVTEYLVDARADAVCVLANFSEQFSLEDVERDRVLDATVAAAAGRMPVIATTSHYSARVARARSRAAVERGASMVMLMAPAFGTSMAVPEDGVVEYFRRVADGLDAEILIQDAPLSATRLTVELLARIAREIPQVTAVKIEVPRAAQKLRDLDRAAGADLPGLFDGEESVTLIPNLDAGAVATMCSAVDPARLGDVVRAHAAGDRARAVEEWETVLPLLHFENRQCGPLAAKILLREGGVIASDRARAPMPDVGPETRDELVRLARRFDPLILRWAS